MNEEQRKKILIMRIGVISLVTIIFAIWSINLRQVWHDNNAAASKSQKNLQELKTELNQTMAELNARLAESAKSSQTPATTIEASSTLIADLIKETERLASSSEISTSSTSTKGLATSSLPTKNCPQYIDCMPKIGGAPSCKIPAGCEGITQIAY